MRRWRDNPVRAFTLIEILIAVLILALGILGLGAVFPAVIREQRVGTEATSGALAANCAKTLLTSMDYEQVLVPLPTVPPPTAQRDFWRNWRDQSGQGLGNNANYENGQWFVPTVDIPASPSGTVMGLASFSTYSFRLPISERMYPYGSSNINTPQFVWDVAVHRISDGVAGNTSAVDPLQVAIFVRRIDSRIRPGPGMTIFQSFTAPGSSRRWPVGATPGTGLPTQDGTGGYARLFTAPATFTGAPDRDRLYFPGVTLDQWAMIRQTGQRLIDNLGNVYTVTGYAEDAPAGKYVRIDPPVPPGVGQSATAAILQVLVAPNVPAAVLLFKAVDP